MWQPGQSGNPAGRPPKGEALTEILKSKVDKEEIAEKLLELVNNGDLAAIKYVYDRVDGRPKETIEGTFTEIPRYLGFQLPPDADEPEDSEADTE